MIKSNLVDASYRSVYTDAFALDETSIGLSDLSGMVIDKVVHNLLVLSGARAGEFRPERAEWAGLLYTLAVIPLALGIGLRKRDALLTATGVTTCALFVLLLGSYTIFGLRGLRFLMMLQPLVAVAFARSLDLALERGPRLLQYLVPGLIIPAALTWAIWQTQQVYRWQPVLQIVDTAHLRFLEDVGHDDSRVLVAPESIALPYFVAHHPVQWSFVPANLKTFELLEREYELGTVILPSRRAVAGTELTREDLERAGWDRIGMATVGTEQYQVFRPGS